MKTKEKKTKKKKTQTPELTTGSVAGRECSTLRECLMLLGKDWAPGEELGLESFGFRVGPSSRTVTSRF